jgi:hypothetical protein
MTPLQKRFLLFLAGCMGSRVLFTLLAKNTDIQYLPILGYIALLPAIGFFYIYVTGSRKTGLEVGGGKIWWNNLRPFHSILYFLFAYNAITKHVNSWKYLALDTFMGLMAFLSYHYENYSFQKLM